MKKKQVVDPSDEQRCRQAGGRGWRCKRLRCTNSVFCEEHYVTKKKKRSRDEGSGGGLEVRKVKSRVCTRSKQRVPDDLQEMIQQTDDDDEGTYQCQTSKRCLVDAKRGCTDKSKLAETAEHVVELEEELELYKTKCRELTIELEKKKMEFGDLESSKISVENELKDCITNLKEDQKVVYNREKMAQDKITYLEEDLEIHKTKYRELSMELKEGITSLKEDHKVVCEREKRAQERITYLEEKLKNMESVRFVQLKRDIIDLEHTKRRAEDENDAFKKRFCELENRVLRMEEGKSNLRCMEPHATEKIGLERGGIENEVPHIGEGEKDRNKTSKVQGEINGGTNSSHVAHLQTKEKMLNASERNVTSASTGSTHLPSLTGNRDVHVTGPPSINILCEPSIIVEVKEKNNPLASKVEGTSNESQSVLDPGSVRPASEEKDLTSKKCLKRPCLDQQVEEDRSACEEDLLFTSTHKPKWDSEIMNSESESKDQVKMKCHELKDGVLKHSPLKLCPETLNASCRGKNVENKNDWAERTSHNECSSLNQLKTNGMSYEKVGRPTAEDDKEETDTVEEDGLDVYSDSSDSGDSSDSEDAEEAFDKVLATLISRRRTELKWRLEADMLSSFEDDPELCMKAVCALYRQQTSEEKSMKGVLQYSDRGFDKFDALRGTTLGKFLTDGDQKGDLKKSVDELEMFDSKALEDCQRLARHYSEQLFTIYQNKEDPFFLPISSPC